MTSFIRLRGQLDGSDGAVRSLWLQEALGDEARVPAREPFPRQTDVCVVGGGLTGLWTALAIKRREPSRSVVVLERDVCGSGASGRNGGFVMSMWSKLGSLKKVCGADDAVRFAQTAEDAISATHRFCVDNGIDAQFSQGGWLWAATNNAQVGAWDAAVREAAEVGATPYTLLDRDEVQSRSGSPLHLAGLFEPKAATVQPALLVRGLARVARESGVEIHERTPVLGVGTDGVPVVRTPRGSLRAERVVLAINAWAAGIRQLRRALVVIASDVVASEPIPDQLRRIGWQDGLSISDSRRLVNYYRVSKDGRVIFGKGGGTLAMRGTVGAAFNRPSARATEVVSQFRRIYPMLGDVTFPVSWRGPIDYSLTGLPFVCSLERHPHILVGAGYSGNGVGPSYVVGRALAELALTGATDVVPLALQRRPPGSLPPEPFRHLGGLLVRAAVARKETAEDLERRPGQVATLLAKLDPTSFVDRNLRPPVRPGSSGGSSSHNLYDHAPQSGKAAASPVPAAAPRSDSGSRSGAGDG